MYMLVNVYPHKQVDGDCHEAVFSPPPKSLMSSMNTCFHNLSTSGYEVDDQIVCTA